MKWPEELVPQTGNIECHFQSYVKAAYGEGVVLKPAQMSTLRDLFFGGAVASFALIIDGNVRGEEALLARFDEVDSELRAHGVDLEARGRADFAKEK